MIVLDTDTSRSSARNAWLRWPSRATRVVASRDGSNPMLGMDKHELVGVDPACLGVHRRMPERRWDFRLVAGWTILPLRIPARKTGAGLGTMDLGSHRCAGKRRQASVSECIVIVRQGAALPANCCLKRSRSMTFRGSRRAAMHSSSLLLRGLRSKPRAPSSTSFHAIRRAMHGRQSSRRSLYGRGLGRGRLLGGRFLRRGFRRGGLRSLRRGRCPGGLRSSRAARP